VLASPFATKDPAWRFFRQFGAAVKRKRYIVLHTTAAINNTIGIF